MRTELVLLDIARKDLKAARCLFKERLYCQAVFYLEQTVEKATKSLGIYNKAITEDELEKIGHESWKVYTKILEQTKVKIGNFYKNLERFPKLKQTSLVKEFESLGASKLNNLVKNLAFFIESGKFVTKEELQAIILEISKFEKEIENTEMKVDEDEIKNLKTQLVEVVDILGENNPIVSKKIKKELELLSPKLLTNLWKSLTSLISCFLSLFYLSIILCPHAVRSRYPINRNKFNPLEIYTKVFPVIEKFDQLSNIIERVLDKMTNVFSENPLQKIRAEIDMSGE